MKQHGRYPEDDMSRFVFPRRLHTEKYGIYDLMTILVDAFRQESMTRHHIVLLGMSALMNFIPAM
jgi:hypothetical protein